MTMAIEKYVYRLLGGMWTLACMSVFQKTVLGDANIKRGLVIALWSSPLK